VRRSRLNLRQKVSYGRSPHHSATELVIIHTPCAAQTQKHYPGCAHRCTAAKRAAWKYASEERCQAAASKDWPPPRS